MNTNTIFIPEKRERDAFLKRPSILFQSNRIDKCSRVAMTNSDNWKLRAIFTAQRRDPYSIEILQMMVHWWWAWEFHN